MSEQTTPDWPTRLVAGWARRKSGELRDWSRRVRKAYSVGTPLGRACGPYADALLDCAAVLERCADSLVTQGGAK